MFAQNLEERVALNKMTVMFVSSAQTEERSVKKKKPSVKIMCELMFSIRDCAMGEYFSCIYF